MIKILFLSTFFLFFLLLLGVDPIEAARPNDCTEYSQSPYTKVKFSDNNDGTVWGVRAIYYGDGPGTSRDFNTGYDLYVSDGGEGIILSCYNAQSNDYVVWGTSCVDPKTPIDVEKNCTYEGSQLVCKTIQYVDVTCRTSRGSYYKACDNPNGHGFVGYYEKCPSRIYCATSGSVISCDEEKYCPNGSCDKYEKYCSVSSGEPRCLSRLYQNNGCAECTTDASCGNNSQYCKGCTCVQYNSKCVMQDGDPTCVKSKCDPSDANCFDGLSCGNGCIGSIDGKVYIDKNDDNNFDSGEGYTRSDTNSENLTVQRGQISGGRFNVGDERAPDPNYKFGNLLKGSSHDVRVINYWGQRLAEDNSNPRTNVEAQVGGNTQDFRFRLKKFRVYGKVFWDEDADPSNNDGASLPPYVNYKKIPGKAVTICAVGESNCDTTNPDLRPWNPDAGKYSLTGLKTDMSLDGKAYTIRIKDFREKHHAEENNIVINVKGDDVRVNFYIAPDGYTISGVVYEDNGDRILNKTQDKPYQLSQVRVDINPGDKFDTTDRNDGRYTTTGNLPGSYNAAITSGLLSGYSVVSGYGTRSTTVPPNQNNVDFLVEKTDTSKHYINGAIFLDENEDGNQDCPSATDCPEPFLDTWPSGTRITLNPGNSSKSGPDSGATDGYYTYNDLTGTSYTVRLTGTGATHTKSYPGSTDTYTITNLGSGGCSVVPSGRAKCTVNNDVVDVIFGIKVGTPVIDPWFQSVGGNMRHDRGMSITIPSGQYMSITQGSSAKPGIIFNFNTYGDYSVEGWNVFDTGYYYPPLKLSYENVLKLITKAGETLTSFFNQANSPCSGSSPNCTLPANVAEGFYKNEGDVTISSNASSFRAGRNYIFLVNGKLTISGDITVPRGSVAIFIASDNITVQGGVRNLEGIYVTNKNFIVNDGANQLVVEGSVSGNAINDPYNLPNTNPFRNNRSLGADNIDTPAIKFIYRPDFVLNAPNIIKNSSYKLREVAPQGTR